MAANDPMICRGTNIPGGGAYRAVEKALKRAVVVI
jgi:hypothetical protein